MCACKCLFYALVSTLLTFSDAVLFDSELFGNSGTNLQEMERIRMIYYEGSSDNPKVSQNYTLAQSDQLVKNVDLEKPFVLYIHGYEEVPTNESVQTIVSAYLHRGSDNIVVLDWSEFAFGNYVTVALRVKDISRYTAKALGSLAAAGLNVDTLHVVGHSLGAQIAGFIGQYLDFRIPRITGLDPANPLFYQFGAEHINASSGKFVDIIHTDGGMYGAYSNTGTVDFYANGGVRPQPGCQLLGVPLTPRSLCSHWRSWRFYAESVIDDKAFPAVQCSSYINFRIGMCKENEVVYFGYSVPKNISGAYHFSTESNTPFGRGLRGI